jgi:hypothetical protein
MKCLAAVAVSMCLVVPPVAAQIFSWDPLRICRTRFPRRAERKGLRQVNIEGWGRGRPLYEIAPGTRRTIERSAGYGVFSTFGVKLFFAGGTTGKGMVVNLRSGRQTFMKMLQVQGGLGFGVNQNRLIFVFANEPALKNFINQGWEFGGQANRHNGRRGAKVARPRWRPACTYISDADRPFGIAHRRRHEVLQGWRSELKRSPRY